MNEHDHAIVIGIGRYADADNHLGWIRNLSGPDNDADEIAAWLRDPAGGALAPRNVRVVRSADLPDPFPPGGAGPAQEAVCAAIRSIADLPATAYQGQFSGRRFYLYVSGHGWAGRRNEAAVVTAEATHENKFNVLASDWIDWLWYANRFRELVFWADACATRTSLDILHRCKLPQEFAVQPDALRFDAFAARFNLLSVENQMPDGRWHGAFTYALLQALRGAVPGPVTTGSVRNYLLNNMAAFMRDDQHVPTVSQEPDFGRTDDIELVSAPPPALFPVTLRFRDDCIGRRAIVSTRASLPPAADTVLAQAEWQPALPAGEYVASVPDLHLMSTFTVRGGGVDGPVTVP